ncbi:HEAT repeat domain-containing protein [Paenibacillus sp. H1-7]|uniref:HEAT repeat domain-containing protein n=1 Tax=Paenibacillus sp. H1-7 TaxID=2282849 RepID=UPI001EF9B139|nr:HEAT repeat domain-containing protein [Paenibacillus sp. H1-7]ULL13981.1 HEAT repeat domain-containing protein [Paenibacillus sp. H1-7]
MSIQVLNELHSEVRRLFIAGSTLAQGDGRLNKLLPQLHKLGESAPVFRKVAQSVEQLVESSGEEASVKLLELGTLLHSILYTQGQTDASGAPEPLETANTNCYTGVSYRKLTAAIDALTQKGPGRLEIIRQSYEEGVFKDIRTMIPAVVALDETYPEIADYMMETVIPSLGEQVLTILKSQFQPGGGKGAVRRLQQIHRIAGMKERELYLSCLTEGSLEVRAAAIELLGAYDECEPILLEQSLDKKKEIRIAAYNALAELASAKAVERLFQAFTGKDRDNVIDPIRCCKAESLTGLVLDFADGKFRDFVDRAATEETVPSLDAAAQCLDGKRALEVSAFWMKLLSTPLFIVKETDSLQHYAARQLLETEQPETDEFLLSLYDQWNRKFISYSFHAAVRMLPPEAVYDRFAIQFQNKQQSSARELIHTMTELTEPRRGYWNPAVVPEEEHGAEGQTAQEIVWDERWVHLFVAINEEELVCRLAQHEEDSVIKYLVKKWEVAPQQMKPRTVSILRTLHRLSYEQAPELIMQSFEKAALKHMYYLDREQQYLLAVLPGSYSERVEQLAERMAYDSVKRQVQDIADLLKSKGNNGTIEDNKGAGWIEWIKSRMY